ncbi:MAG: hypothetical protein ACRDRV_06135 [Pseudonocardiaceae bacterium]
MAALHSEAESYRCVLALRTPEGQGASLIVLRRGSAVWLSFHGAMKTTVTLTNEDAGRLIDAITEARSTPR